MEKFIRCVAQFIDNRKMKNYYGTHLDMNVRYFNIVLTLLIIFPILSAIFVFSLSHSYLLPTILLFTSMFYLIIFVSSNKSKHYYKYICIVIYIFNFVLLPLVFLFGGGIEYGVWLYFMMGLFLSVFFLRQKLLVFTLILQSIYYSVLLYIEYTYPIFLHKVCETFRFNLFAIPEHFIINVNFFIVAFSLGIVIKSIFVSYIDVHKTELKLVDKLEQQTIRDPLTGTYNRRHLYCYLESLIKSTEKDGTSFCIVMFDIDKFKVLNDTYGHLIGDEVLCDVSKLLMSDLREYDIVARYGGEEFVVILPSAKECDAVKRADQIRQKIEEFNFNDKITKPVTISGGVSFFKKGMSASKIIEVADTNLYKAKETGRNKIVCANYSSYDFIELDDKTFNFDKNDNSKTESEKTKVIMCE